MNGAPLPGEGLNLRLSRPGCHARPGAAAAPSPGGGGRDVPEVGVGLRRGPRCGVKRRRPPRCGRGWGWSLPGRRRAGPGGGRGRGRLPRGREVPQPPPLLQRGSAGAVGGESCGCEAMAWGASGGFSWSEEKGLTFVSRRTGGPASPCAVGVIPGSLLSRCDCQTSALWFPNFYRGAP